MRSRIVASLLVGVSLIVACGDDAGGDDAGGGEINARWESETLMDTYLAGAMMTFVAPESSSILQMNADGTDVTQLTTNTEAIDYPAGWSKDGKQIIFSSDRDGDTEIFTMDSDGTNIRQITTNDDEDDFANLSPDGKQIAFYSDRDGDYEIFVANIDGTKVRQLTTNPAGDFDPKWSRDGSLISFTSDRYGDEQIFVINTDGTNVISTGVAGYPLAWIK